MEKLKNYGLSICQLFRLRPYEPLEERITIVAIDEVSLHQVGSWPISDGVIAQLLQKLNAYKPRAIGLDIYRDLPVEPGYENLVKAYKSMPNLIGIEQLANNKNASVLPLPVLNQLDQVGFNNVLYDPDGKIRRSLLYWHIDNQAHESFALKLALLYLKSENITPQTAAKNSEYLQLGQAVFKRFQANDGAYVGADDRGYQILSNFPKPSCSESLPESCSYRQVSMRDVLADRVPKNWISDRIILIGSTAPSLQDFVFVPKSSRFMGAAEPIAGVELQAHFIHELISAALEGRSLLKVWPKRWEYFWIFAWSICGSILIFQSRSLIQNILILILLVSSVLYVGYWAFLSGWWLPLLPTIISLLGCSIITLIIKIELTKNRLEKFHFCRTLELIFEICSTNPVVGFLSIEYLITSTQEPEITAQSLSSIAVSALVNWKNPDEIAPMVLFACEKAVTLAPDNCNIHDSRGLARALTGDYQGAIADFEAYIAQTNHKKRKAQRCRWVKDLKLGKNPFTDGELKQIDKGCL